MAYLAVNKDGQELIFESLPERCDYEYWTVFPSILSDDVMDRITLPQGSIEKLIGRELTWDDEPIEI
jgi:hypothetical protein